MGATKIPNEYLSIVSPDESQIILVCVCNDSKCFLRFSSYLVHIGTWARKNPYFKVTLNSQYIRELMAILRSEMNFWSLKAL